MPSATRPKRLATGYVPGFFPGSGAFLLLRVFCAGCPWRPSERHPRGHWRDRRRIRSVYEHVFCRLCPSTTRRWAAFGPFWNAIRRRPCSDFRCAGMSHSRLFRQHRNNGYRALPAGIGQRSRVLGCNLSGDGLVPSAAPRNHSGLNRRHRHSRRLNDTIPSQCHG